MAIAFNPLSRQIIYASRNGIQFDGSDQSAPLQALLNRGQNEIITLVIDGPVSCKGLKIYSGTTLEGLGNQSVITQLPATNIQDGCALRNAHFKSPYQGATIVDHDITIRNIYVDGNRRGGASGNPDDPRNTLDGSSVTPIEIFGCNRFLLENIFVYDPCSGGILLANVFGPGATVRNITVIDPDCVGGVIPGPDGSPAVPTGNQTVCIQVDGPASDLCFDGLFGQVGDDFFALNTQVGTMADGDPAAPFYPMYYNGAISRVIATNLFPNVCANVVRLLSSTPPITAVLLPVSDVIVEHVVGRMGWSTFVMGGFGTPTSGTGQGSYSKITFRDWNVDFLPGTSSNPQSSSITGTVNSLAISGFKIGNRPHQLSAPILFELGSGVSTTADRIVLDNWSVKEDSSADGSAYPILSVTTGTIDELAISDFSWSRNASTDSAIVDASGGTINRISVNGASVNNVNHIVNVDGGTVGGVVTTNIIHRGAGGNASVNRSSGTLSRLRSAGSDTALLSAGTIASKKTDSTEDA